MGATVSTTRFDHLELTFPRGALSRELRDDIDSFWCNVIGWSSREHFVYGVSHHLLEIDDDKFILLGEVDAPMNQPPDDFFGDLRDIHTVGLDGGKDFVVTDELPDDTVVFVPHIALMYDTFDELDEILAECERFQEKDPRLVIKNWPAYETSKGRMSRNVLLKYLMPMWFELHAISR
jgi:hypothetical protein